MDLGLAADEFRHITMRQFGVLYRRHQSRELNHQQMEDYRCGLLASLFVNSKINTEKTPAVGPDYFFPSLLELKPPKQTQRQMFNVIQAMARRQKVLAKRKT